MKLWGRVKRFFDVLNKVTDEGYWLPLGARSEAGVSVSVDRAKRISTALRCGAILGETQGALPLQVFERTGHNSRELARNFPLYDLLHTAPNERMDSFFWRYIVSDDLEFRGNSYHLIERYGAGSQAGSVRALHPVHPDCAEVGLTPEGRVVYDVRFENGEIRRYLPFQILHFKGMPDETRLKGLSTVRAHCETLGLAIAARDFMAHFLRDDARPRGVLEEDKESRYSPEDRKQIAKDWMLSYSGVERFKTPFLPKGVSYKAVSINPEDAQLLQLFNMTREEICGEVFGIPPVLLGMNEKVSSWGTGIEQILIGFIMFSMLGRFSRIQQAIAHQVLTPAERRRYFVEFNIDGLLKADVKTRNEAFQIARQGGWMNANEIREKLNMNPLPAEVGDAYWMPSNMVVAGKPVKEKESKQARQLALALADRRGGNVNA